MGTEAPFARKPLWDKGFWLDRCIEQVYDDGVLEDLKAAVERVCVDPTALADAEGIVELYRALARLEGAATVAAAAFDAGGEWAGGGALSAPAWISVRCGVPKAAARRRVNLGRALRHLPVAESAWLAGDVGVAQVAALAAARTPATEAAMARDESLLVEKAKSLRYDHFTRVLAYWAQLADPDGTEDSAAKQRDERGFDLSRSFGGSWIGDFVLDPIGGSVVDTMVRGIEAELFAADWAEAKARVGEAVDVPDLRRTHRQRRADALVEMAIRAGTAPADGRRPAPLFTTLVDYETFAGRICELADGTVVSPGSLLGWLDEALVERIVFDGPGRVLDVGVTRRLFDGASRRAVQAMFPECFNEFCDVRSDRCQIDHVEPYAAGGLTVTDNGRPACGFHNRWRNRGPEPPLRAVRQPRRAQNPW